MQRLLSFLVGLSLLVGIAESAAATGSRFTKVKVMTRNLYLGADLTPVIAAPPEEFLQKAAEALAQVAANDFPTRADALAAEIQRTRPDVIGIQEAFNFTFDVGSGPLNGPPPFRDMLTDLMDALAARGLHYTVVGSVQNLDLSVPGVPVPGLGNVTVGVTDRDVIIVRDRIAASASPVPFSAICARPDVTGGPGCNFSVVAPTPLGVNVERGFIAVDATVRGKAYRFVNTHLEVQSPDPTNPFSPGIQAAQAQELIALVDGFPNPGALPIVAIGDFNSSPDDPVIVLPPVTIVPPYIQLVAAGYADSWDNNVLGFLNPDGYTCCQASDLANATSELDERIDLLFVKGAHFYSFAIVQGNRPLGAVPNWSSDHAGVLGALLFRRH